MIYSFNIYSLAASAGFLKSNPNLKKYFEAKDYLPFVRKTGLKGIEVPLDVYFDEMRDVKALQFIELCNESEIAIYPCLENFNPCFLKKNIGLLKELGANSIRIKMPHLGATFYGGNRYRSDHYNLSLENFRLAMEKLDPILNDFDFKVAIENHQDLDVVDLIRLCENSRSGKVGVTWDVGNSLSTMRTPHSFFKKISVWILNVHLKDYRAFRTESGFSLRRCVLGEGVTDLKTIASEIIKLPWLENISMELAAHPDRHCDLYSFGYAEAFEHSLEERREFTSWLEARLFQEVVTRENSIVVDNKLISREESEASISVAKFKELFCV